MIAIIDYDVGNLKNVYTALKDVDLEGVITRDPKVVDNAEAIILPGVGAFSDAMEHLRPVSYTHLDVYKRQSINRPLMVKSRRLTSSLTSSVNSTSSGWRPSA